MSSSKATLSRGPSLTDAALQAIREEIRHRTLVPGTVYSVYQLAAQLGVSRSPVREALVKLSEAGLVRFNRNRGFQILLPQPRDIAEIFAIRLALEPAAAARVATSATTGQREDLRRAIEVLAAAAGAPVTPDLEAQFWRRDRELHRLLLTTAGNSRAADVIEGLRSVTGLLTPPTSANARSLQQIAAEHQEVLDAVLAGDAAAAHRAMTTHLSQTGRLLMSVMNATAEPSVRDRPAEAELDQIWFSVTQTN